MNNFSSLIENSKQAVRYWWLLLIIGIALFAVGVLIFVYPAQSYLGMSLVFGWLMLISGILEVVLSSANKHFITGRGWMMAGGIIEIILGIILIFNVALSAATLPIFLGFWLMLSLRVYTRRILSHISWPLFFGLLAGVLDEGIQMFADGRGSDVRDVVIDFSGVVFGLLAALFLLLLVRMFHVLRESKTPL